jgi:hypothetical protein
MPSYTSVQSGYWSNPATWGGSGVPKEGDTVTIAAGHTVIFDTDMSGFPNGLAGLTINGTLLIPSLNDPSYPEVGEDTSGDPWLEGWSYRRTVIVDNSFSSTALTDYQIIIRLNTAYLIQQGKMRSDCGDIRVTDSSGNLLPIWIDPATKNLWNTKIYVKVPSIPANGTVTLYLFYGNPDATDISDGSATFDFFDDFPGTTLDTNKWTAARWYGTGSWSVTVGNGYVEINSGSGTRAGIVSKTAFALPFIVEGNWRYVSGDEMWNGITQTNGGSHSDLVEHGYDEQYRSPGDGNIRYYYRKASGGSYSNYQYFSRYAPRESFTRFAIEWLTNAGRYYEWDIQVNSTTTQDRYTSGSCYIQLSTIAGVAQWDWIAVRKYAATPPAVYFRTLTWTALKVNANIAGTGTLQVGSESYAIAYPQKAQIFINGTIQTTYFMAYGETRRTWDWFEFDATVNPPRLYLKNGIPLRKGDVLIVYNNDPVPVLDYDPSTRTVVVPRSSWNRTGERVGFPRTTLLLMTYCIDILKFGGNNVHYASGTNFTFVGTFFTRLSLFVPSASGVGGNLTNPTFKYCGNYRMTPNDSDGHWVKSGGGTGYWQWCALESGTNAWGWSGNGWSSSSISTIEDCCIQNPRWGMSIQGLNTYLRCYQQGGANGFGYITPQAGSTWDGCVFIDSGGNSFSYIIARNCKLINASGLGGSYNLYENIQFYNDSGNRTYLGGTRHLFRNIEIHLNSTHGNILLSGARQCRVYNVTIYSYVNAPFLSISNDVWGDNIIEGLSVSGNCHVRLMGDPSSDYNASFGMQMLGRFANLSVPILSGNYGNIPGNGIVYHPAGYWNIEQLAVGSIYNRAAVHTLRWDARFGSLIRLISSVRISGLTVGTTQYPNALEFIGFHGWAKNRWDAAEPDYQTFDFYMNPTVAGYYGVANMGPVIAWWVFKGNASITVTGTITQLGTGEKVVVEIYRYPKEPLLYDTPEFRQEFTTVGDIAISWAPPDNGIWVVRVLAYLQQTTNPITITNLQVAGGEGGGGGGGGQTYNVNVSDSVAPTLSDNTSFNNLFSLSDNISATLSDQATLSVPISLSDNLSPTLSDSASVQINASATDNMAATLSDSGAISAEISTTDNIAPTLQDSANLTHSLTVSDNLAPTLSESTQADAQVSATESINPTLNEDVVAGNVYEVGISDQVTPTLSESAQTSTQISAADSITPTLSENVSAGNVYEIGISDQVTPTLSDSSTFTGQVSASDSISPTLSEGVTAGNIYEIGISDQITSTLSDSSTVTGQIAATETITPTLQDSSATQVQVTQTEAISPTIQEAQTVSATLSASDTIAPTLQDSGQVSAQVAATETITPTLQENVTAGNIYNVGISDGVAATLSETVSEQASIAATESITPTLAEDVFAGNIYDISVADNVSPSLGENITEQVTIGTQESINATLTEQTVTTSQISVSEDIAPTLQENISAPSSYSLSISEQIAPTLQENASTAAQVSTTESIQLSLSDAASVTSGYIVSISDSIAPTISENVVETPQITATEIINPSISDQPSSSIQISPTEALNLSAQETISTSTQVDISAQEITEITATESVAMPTSIAVSETQSSTLTDSPTLQPLISVTEDTSVTMSEEIRQFSGWNYVIIEPLNIDLQGEEMEIEIREG